jgi:chromosomal replication initiator protein
VRRAILAKRSAVDDLGVPDEALAEIATHVDSSVRALEGALIRVVAYASMKEVQPTPELVRHVLRRMGAETIADSRSISEIVDATVQEFGVDRRALLSKSRRRDITTARQVAMYLARELTEHNYTDIGRGIGDRDHTTAINAVKRVKAALLTDPAMRASVENLRHRLGRRA